MDLIHEDVITIANPCLGKVVIGASLLTIDLATGEVTAPSIEAAHEAGRVFVESIRQHLPPEPRSRLLMWLGTYRDHLPDEAVRSLQEIAR